MKEIECMCECEGDSKREIECMCECNDRVKTDRHTEDK